MEKLTVFDRIKKLAESRGKKIVDVESDLGMSKNYLYKWKTSNPNSARLEQVADYFNVSMDYLVGRTSNPHTYKDNNTADLVAAHIDEGASEQDIKDIISYIEFKKSQEK